MTAELFPKLLVSDADAAIDFYAKALDATPAVRVAGDDGVVHHAEVTVGSSTLALAQSVEAWGWNDPVALGGTPVLLTVDVADPDSTAERMVRLGGEVVIPIENRPYGKRQGRVKDPFGHLWVISGDLR